MFKKFRTPVLSSLAIAFTAIVGIVGPAQAETFRWAGATDPQTMDPHATNSAPVLGFLNNVYEGLVRRNKAMQIESALAESWEQLGADGWRFTLRSGVTFHDGSELTADDVLFSCLLYTSPSPRDATLSRMPSSA